MTRYEITVENHTCDGVRRRTVFYAGRDGLQWFRRELVDEDGTWVRQTHDPVRAQTVGVAPLGAGETLAGP